MFTGQIMPPVAHRLHDGLSLLLDRGVAELRTLKGPREEGNGSARLIESGGQGKVRCIALDLERYRFVDGMHRGLGNVVLNAVEGSTGLSGQIG